jgi:hypothetical protein
MRKKSCCQGKCCKGKKSKVSRKFLFKTQKEKEVMEISHCQSTVDGERCPFYSEMSLQNNLNWDEDDLTIKFCSLLKRNLDEQDLENENEDNNELTLPEDCPLREKNIVVKGLEEEVEDDDDDDDDDEEEEDEEEDE